MAHPSKLRQLLQIPVFVAALGYFLDIYGLLLFSIVRVPSLQYLGVTGEQLLEDGLYLINIQMGGMLLGGFLWGVLGDKQGRLSVLFGSILLYSLANIANGFVKTVEQYVLLRFVVGIGLAGELGVLGAVLAYLVAYLFDWQIAYFIGGGLGLALLVSVFESGMFQQVKNRPVTRGIFFMLFSYIGLSLGDFSSGFLSQYVRSRKRIVLAFILLTCLFVLMYLLAPIQSSTGTFYFVCICLGIGIGYWALFVTIAAEQFGTNLRVTVATTVP